MSKERESSCLCVWVDEVEKLLDYILRLQLFYCYNNTVGFRSYNLYLHE